jgi:hypothetical protein
MGDQEPKTEQVEAEPQWDGSPMPVIGATEWEAATHDPAVEAFVRQAVAQGQVLKREGLIFP